MFAQLVVLPLLLAAAPPQQMDTKHYADALVRQLRATQPADLSWGESLEDACRALDALARAPRAYTDLDGPFFRVPAQRIAQAKPGTLDDALVVLALGQCLNGQLAQARDAALQRLLAGPPRRDYDALIALRTYPAPDLKFPAPQPGDEPGVAVLLASDPASVPAPPVTDVPSWTRWARAARLRGVQLQEVPAWPQPAPEAGFRELLAAVQTISAIHGALEEEGHGATADPARNAPALVAPGQDLAAALERAWGYLEANQRGGTFGLPGSDEPEPGITAMALTGAVWVAEKTGRQRPAWIDEGLDFLLSLQRPDGSIQMHGPDVYTTAIGIEALVAGGREKDREAIARARDYLVATQADEGEGYDAKTDLFYGGTGYGDGERADLSNTQFAVQAVALAGTSRDDPFFAKTRTFLLKCQNVAEQQSLTIPHEGGGTIVSGNDGGGIYFPGNSEAGEIQVGDNVWQARSYGSMSYALTKTWMLCGASPDDARVKAVVRWLARNFSVDSNPGFATPEECKQGLYYYRLTMARALALLPEGSFKDESGKVIDWRGQLVRTLLDNQRVDGSWINTEALRWWEGTPPLATAYALLALKAAQG